MTAILLATIMVFGAAPAAFATEQGEGTVQNSDTDYTVGATDSFGKIISNAMQEYTSDAESPNRISKVTYADNAAVVTFATDRSATLIVAVFGEDTLEMLTAESTKVTTEDTETQVAFSVTLPQYFVIKAFLLDADEAALCKEYVCNEKTKMYADFLALTVNDFDDERVINFDEQQNNNFVVLSDGAKTVQCSQGHNTLTSSDVEGGVYVFDNINESMRSLSVGDIFYYDSNSVDETIVIKVKEITFSGTTATVIADSTAVEEAFDCVKISSETKTGGFERTGEPEDGVTYDGCYDEDGNLVVASESAQGDIAVQSVELNPTINYSHSYTVDKEMKPEKPKKNSGWL